MIRAKHSLRIAAAERQALRRRVKQMYDYFNQGLWEKCFSLIDPKISEKSTTEFPPYAERLQEFKEAYGAIRPWYVRISLYLDASTSKRDDRPFAYVYTVWQDDAHGFHMFRERWVRDGNHWFTQVVGLVVNRQELAGNRD
jgi:hypothetical protein